MHDGLETPIRKHPKAHIEISSSSSEEHPDGFITNLKHLFLGHGPSFNDETSNNSKLSEGSSTIADRKGSILATRK